ncbi:histone H2A.V-like [Carcharodon carcharias]|uniref:histone H2A.V-like n=1 Tax=Carcharodon carcharias TaxID=13397 RepID=UPI001B7E2450|nr:histone H2A.V-like [Carcharodon carcharias]
MRFNEQSLLTFYPSILIILRCLCCAETTMVTNLGKKTKSRFAGGGGIGRVKEQINNPFIILTRHSFTIAESKSWNSLTVTIYLATVLQYLVTEIQGLAGNVAQDNKKIRISLHHLQLTIINDKELNKPLGKTTIAQGGVLPNIQAILLPKKTRHPSKVYA